MERGYPSEAAWGERHTVGKYTEMYKRRHNDSIPRKVSYAARSGEFIETEGATIAQIPHAGWNPCGMLSAVLRI